MPPQGLKKGHAKNPQQDNDEVQPSNPTPIAVTSGSGGRTPAETIQGASVTTPSTFTFLSETPSGFVSFSTPLPSQGTLQQAHNPHTTQFPKAAAIAGYVLGGVAAVVAIVVMTLLIRYYLRQKHAHGRLPFSGADMHIHDDSQDKQFMTIGGITNVHYGNISVFHK